METIYKNEILSKSGCCNVNFLVHDNKIYVMDNHLCASWCWEQKINPAYHYGIFHIDRHVTTQHPYRKLLVNKA